MCNSAEAGRTSLSHCECVCVRGTQDSAPREPPVHSPVGTVAFRKQTAPFIESGLGLVDSQSRLVTLVALGTRQAAQTVRICP